MLSKLNPKLFFIIFIALNIPVILMMYIGAYAKIEILTLSGISLCIILWGGLAYLHYTSSTMKKWQEEARRKKRDRNN